MTRIYQAGQWQNQVSLSLNTEASHHLVRVLRKRLGDEITIFNGEGLAARAFITLVDKRKVELSIEALLPFEQANVESPLPLHLYQALSKGDRFEFVIQKAVELGVSSITPILTDRTVVRLDQKRMTKKLEQWHKIIISACEQCGRNTLPLMNQPVDYNQAVSQQVDYKIILHPYPSNRVDLTVLREPIHLFIGPEGGFSQEEIDYALANHSKTWQLGPRILRTETATITALSILQHQLGDL